MPIWREMLTGRTPEGRESPLYGCKLLLFAYDETISSLRKDVAHDAAYRIRDIMVSHFNRYVPDVPVRAEPALMTRWSKGAKTLKDKDGKLTWA